MPHVHEPGARALAHYEAAAAALLDAYRLGTPAAMERHYRYTWHRRAWQAMRTYVQLDLGRRPAHPGDAVDITLDEARHLVAVEHGFPSWPDLVAFTARLRPGRRVTAKPLRVLVRREDDDWEPVAASREWDEVVDLLARHAPAGLAGEGQLTDELLALLPAGESLAALSLSDCRDVTDAGMRHLARLPGLEHLDLSGTRVTGAGLDVLRHLPRLRALSLGGNHVSAAGVGVLAECEALERLVLWAPPEVGDAAVVALADNARLRRLETAVSDAGLARLPHLPAFASWQGGEARLGLVGHAALPTHLTLRGTFTDRGLQHLRGLDGLFSLDIDDRRLAITPAGLEPLAALPRFAVLSVNAQDDWMPAIARLPHLRALQAQDTPAGDEGFIALSRSPTLEYLWGRRCHNLRTRGFLALSTMPALRGLSVSCRNVDAAGLAALPSFPALRELMPMDVPDAEYRHVGRCRALESLVLMYCRETTDAATEHLTGLDRLSYYFNSYTTITDRTPAILATMDSLERVTFDVCHGLTDGGVGRLARLPRLRELRVSGRAITPAVKALFPPGVKVYCGGD